MNNNWGVLSVTFMGKAGTDNWDLSKRLNEKRSYLRKDQMYMHWSLKPLDKIVGDQSMMFDESLEICEEGFCMT